MVTEKGNLCFGLGGACTGQKDGRIYFVGAGILFAIGWNLWEKRKKVAL